MQSLLGLRICKLTSAHRVMLALLFKRSAFDFNFIFIFYLQYKLVRIFKSLIVVMGNGRRRRGGKVGGVGGR